MVVKSESILNTQGRITGVLRIVAQHIYTVIGVLSADA